MDKLEEVKKDIWKAYEEELLKRRRPIQVDQMIIKERIKDHLVDKLAKNLIEKNLEFQVFNYVNCQFFALNYMPYLPKIEHIVSDNGFARWEKYKDWYKEKIKKINYEKVKKKRGKVSVEEYKELLELKNLIDFEESDKKLFFNILRGFDLCIVSTSLYNPKSKYCKKCAFKKICIKVLKKRYPPLLKFRLGQIKDQQFLRTIMKYEFYIY